MCSELFDKCVEKQINIFLSPVFILKYVRLKASLYTSCNIHKFNFVNIFIFTFIVSENESTKGSADCLPTLSYQSSSTIVRLSGANNDSADKVPGECEGKSNSIHLHMQNELYLCLLSMYF